MPVRRLDPANYNLFLLAIAAVVAAGFVLVWWLRRDVAAESGAVTDDDLLKDFERAYFAGEMDEAEFRRVTATLRGRSDRPATVEPTPPVPDRPGPDPEPPTA